MRILPSLLILALARIVNAQHLPQQWMPSPAEHRLKIGLYEDEGLYREDIIRELYLEFDQSNWWNLLSANYGTEVSVPATLMMDGEVYPQVGVSFKGQTSYSMTQGEEKKSFSIKMDEFIEGQDLGGYKTLNLNNCFGDPSFLREFMYLHMIRNHIPAAKCAFIKLFINGESWGIYPSVQQMNKDYLEEWFLSNDGISWRADSPIGGMPGPGGGGGPSWGDGTAALNWLGSDTTEYQTYYTLKSAEQATPWDKLVETCDLLNNTPDNQLSAILPPVLDIDRALWFIACEIAFSDDDSYVYKGKMDYYVYWDAETGTLTPLEYDGNSILGVQNLNWGPFYHADNVNYPLMNQLLNVPEYRQRYLAHVRTIAQQLLDPVYTQQVITMWSQLISSEVQADPKKLYTYNQFLNELNILQTRLNARRTNLLANSEMNTSGAVIGEVITMANGSQWSNPPAGSSIHIAVPVSSPDGLNAVNLFVSDGLDNPFLRYGMADNGLNGDASANDGIWSYNLNGYPGGTVIRFYIEAVEADNARTRSYRPEGAEHDVYYLEIVPLWENNAPVIINEIMADNEDGPSDETGSREDWIELFNRSDMPVDLSGYFISDNAWDIQKWVIPSGITLEPNEYLIVWADEDVSDGPLHANFKLSASGETLSLMTSTGLLADQVTFGIQFPDMGYARIPNGTGNFINQNPTFSSNNEGITALKEESQPLDFIIYPNPARDRIRIRSKDRGPVSVDIFDLSGRVCAAKSEVLSSGLDILTMDISTLSSGTYIVQTSTHSGTVSSRLVVN